MSEAADIRRRWDKFSEVWPAMWRAFLKDVPGKDFKDDVWKQCQYLPVEAWDYVLEQFRDMDKPPRNWAKAIKGIHATWKQRQGEDRESFEPKKRDAAEESFIGRRLVELRENHPDMPVMERLGLAVKQWRGKRQWQPRVR